MSGVPHKGAECAVVGTCPSQNTGPLLPQAFVVVVPLLSLRPCLGSYLLSCDPVELRRLLRSHGRLILAYLSNFESWNGLAYGTHRWIASLGDEMGLLGEPALLLRWNLLH